MASQFSYPDNDPDFEENLWNVMVAEWSSTPTTQPNNPQHAFAELHTTPLSWINNNVPLSSSNHTTTAATGRAMMPSPNNPSSRSLLEAPTFPLVPTGSSDFTDLLANDGTHNTSVEETQRMPHLQRGYSNNPRRRRRCGAQAGGSSRRHTGLPSGLQEKYLNATKNCCDWIQTHPGLEPSPQDLDYLSKTTHVSRQWIRELIKSTVRDQMQSPSGDSGYQTRSIGDPEITKKYESQQPVRRKGRDDRPHTTVKNPTRPFVCTHLCGWDFDKNAAWAKHELIHYPQHVWFCPHCQDLSSGKRVWLRKDHFKKHLTKTHSYNKVTEQHCRTSELPVASRFPRRCHIPGCNKNFKDWDDRMKDMASHMEKDYDTSGWGRLEDEAEYIGTEERAETIADSDSENSDQESRKDDDSDDSDVDQGGPGGGGSGSAGGSGRGQGMNGQGSRKPPPSPDQQRQPGTGHDSSRHSYNTWRGYTGDRMHILTGLATVNRTLHIRDSLPSTSLDVRKPDTTDLERDCEGSMVAKPHWTLRNTQCSSVRWLGSGATARVDEVKTPGAEETMARKVIQYQYPAARQRVEREAYIMHRLQHPHIVRLLKAFKDTSTATLFMRPAADYSLAYYIQTRCSTAPAGREIWKWFSCLVSGLYYMHKQGILHGDIKPDNILIFNNHIFYTDFGLSDTIPDDKSMISDGGFITKQYAAPEVKRGKRGKPSDIWSLGCVFLELVTIMLHRSITDFYDGRKLSKAKQSGKTVDSSYSNNMVAVAKWIKALRQVSYMDQASAPVLTGLDSCQRMMILEPKQRMSALQLSSRMPPRPCCVSCQHASPRHDKPLDSHSFVSRDAMNYLFKRRCQATSHGASGKVLADVDTLPRSERNPWPRVMGSIHRRHTALSDEGIPMPESSTLSHWLSEPNSYEALVTGHVDIFKTRSKSFVIDFLDSLINKIDSQCVTTLSAEGQLFESHEIVDSHDHVETAGQGDLTNWFSQCNAEEDIRDVSVLNKPTQSELHVYSRAKHIWLHVTCTLDTRTRQDCVSQELVDKLGVQNDASFHCVEKPEFRHDKTKQCRTVKLSWYESTSRQTRENWFVVVEGSFDIVIGSDFLLTHAVFTYRQSAIWTSDWRRAQETNTPKQNDSCDGESTKKLSIKGRAAGLRRLTNRAKSHLKQMRNRKSNDQSVSEGLDDRDRKGPEHFQQASSGLDAQGSNGKVELPFNHCPPATQPSTALPPGAFLIEDIAKNCISETRFTPGTYAAMAPDVREENGQAPATGSILSKIYKAGKQELLDQTHCGAAAGKSYSPKSHALMPFDNKAPRVTKRSRVYQTLRGIQSDRSANDDQLKQSRYRLTGRGIPMDSRPQHWLDGLNNIEGYPQSHDTHYIQTASRSDGNTGLNYSSQVNGQPEQEHPPAEP